MELPELLGTATNNPIINFERLKSEQVRLSTFQDWSTPFIKPEDCAKAGFFYLHDSDKVQCVFCHGVIGNWEPGDNPMLEHKRHFRNCSFVCGVCNTPTTGNVMGANGVDVCGPSEPVLRTRCDGYPGGSAHGARPINTDLNSLAIRTGSGPCKKDLVTLEARLSTFANWSSSINPEELSSAGFYYIGLQDHVKCFYCDGGLRDWEDEDDPWTEHAKWFSQCPYVLLNKGVSWVKEVMEKKPKVNVPEMKLQSSGSQPKPSDDDLRQLLETPIVQDALSMGMDIGKVKSALREKLERTGQPFNSTMGLLEAVLHDPEYYSGSDTESESDEDADRDYVPARTILATRLAKSAVNSHNSESTERSEAELAGLGSSNEEYKVGIDGTANSNEAHNSSEDPCPGPSSNSATSKVESKRSTSQSSDSGHSDGSEDEQKSAPDHKDLQEEIRLLKEARQCKICMDQPADVVFLPCGHLIACVRCATAISHCALCREPIRAVVRTYMA